MPEKIFFNDKTCLHCKCKFNRKMTSSKKLESAYDFRIRKFCSHKCFSDFNTLENHFLYNPNGSISKDGYKRITIRGQKARIREHRAIMKDFLKRKLSKNEHIHHKNGNKLDNRIENLELVTNSEHRKIHAKTQKRNEYGLFTR